jgi:iron complex outermembrane receptor protein
MFPGTKTKTLVATLALIASVCARAQETEELDEMSRFLDLLEQQTTLATKTRLNADFVPGMLSVLSSEQLQRRGYRTVWDSLASLPGVLASIEETGMRSVSVRGIGKLFEPGKVKLLLNGEAVNASASATTGTLFDMPVEQIERIEFIRGPGSAVHGEFAYAGVLNVITRKTGEQYSVGAESTGGGNFSAIYSFGENGGEFSGNINIAASSNDGEDIEVDEDASPPGVTNYAPGPINNKREIFSAILDLNFDNLNALVQVQQANRGDYFGSSYLLPPDERQTVISDTLISAVISQPYTIDDRLSGKWAISLLQNDTEKNKLFLGTAEAFGGIGGEDDIVADSKLTEDRVELMLNLQYEGEKHTLFTEISANQVTVGKSEQFINLDPVTNLPSPDFNEFPGPVDDSLDRGAVSLVLQDEFHIDDMLTLTSGVRYDNYENIESAVSPRIALVWRRSENHIFKAQYARAFRPPSLIETGGALSSSIAPETNDTFELGHIYVDTDLTLRNTVYYTKLDELIVFQDTAPFGYLNMGSSELVGYELEVEKSITDKWEILGSLSLQDYVDKELPAAAPWMLKLGVGYMLTPSTELHLQVNSVSARDREEGDPRDDFERTTQADIALHTKNVFDVTGLNLRWGVTNLLGDEIAYPAPADTYPDDFITGQAATFWAQLLYQPL